MVVQFVQLVDGWMSESVDEFVEMVRKQVAARKNIAKHTKK